MLITGFNYNKLLVSFVRKQSNTTADIFFIIKMPEIPILTNIAGKTHHAAFITIFIVFFILISSIIHTRILSQTNIGNVISAGCHFYLQLMFAYHLQCTQLLFPETLNQTPLRKQPTFLIHRCKINSFLERFRHEKSRKPSSLPRLFIPHPYQ